MKAPTGYVEARARQLRPGIYAIGIAMSLFLAAGGGAAQGLPEEVTGKAHIYDGVTFDLIQDGGRYRTATRIRLEAVDSCELGVGTRAVRNRTLRSNGAGTLCGTP